MKRINRFSQIIGIEMCIYLSGGDGRMTKHLLHGAKISAAFDEVCGKGVSQTVR